MRFIDTNKAFVNFEFLGDRIATYDVEVEDAKDFLGFEVKDEP